MNEEQQPKSQKKLTGGSPKQSTIAREFLLSLEKSSKVPFKKNDYRSVIDITFMSDIVSHMVVFRHLIKIMADVENT